LRATSEEERDLYRWCREGFDGCWVVEALSVADDTLMHSCQFSLTSQRPPRSFPPCDGHWCVNAATIRSWSCRCIANDPAWWLSRDGARSGNPGLVIHPQHQAGPVLSQTEQQGRAWIPTKFRVCVWNGKGVEHSAVGVEATSDTVVCTPLAGRSASDETIYYP
jgi:hypothetical protein